MNGSARNVLFSSLLVLAALSLRAEPQVVLTGAFSNPQPHNGEAVRLDVTLKNDGPENIDWAVVEVALDGGIVLNVEPGSGNGYGTYTSGIYWSAAAMPAGSAVTRAFDVRIDNGATSAAAEGKISTFSYSTGTANAQSRETWTFRIEVPVQQAAMQSDVALSFSQEPANAPLDVPIELHTTVSNLGPHDARDLLLVLSSPSRLVPSVAGGSCERAADFAAYICRIPLLAAGTATVVVESMPASAAPQTWYRAASVTFPDRTDPVPSNNRIESTLTVGIGQIGTVLVPLVMQPADGAFGSHWITEFSMFVDGDTTMFVFPLLNDCHFECPMPVTIGEAPAKQRWSPPLWTEDGFPGYLLHFDTRRAGSIAFEHRIRDTSRETEGWGTEVPVVAETDFLKGRTQLIDVAGGSGYRQTLRLYRPDAMSGSVTVSVYGESTAETLLGSQTISIMPPPAWDWTENQLPVHASYAQVDLQSAFPGISSYPRLRVEIDPDGNDWSYWGFVSVTNNQTQQVTLVTPQR